MATIINKQDAKRKATEARILKAFEKVLKRDGFQKLGVNAIVKEAGVGKGLIYDYFGGLNGLADAWVEKAHFVPDVEEIAGCTLDDFLEKTIAEQIADVHVNYAGYLRKTPLALELYAEELQKSTSLSKSAEHVRKQIGITHEKFFTEINPITDSDHIALIFVLQAASNYLAMRARTSPNYNGLMIDSDEGWNQLMDMLKRVAKRFEEKE